MIFLLIGLTVCYLIIATIMLKAVVDTIPSHFPLTVGMRIVAIAVALFWPVTGPTLLAKDYLGI